MDRPSGNVSKMEQPMSSPETPSQPWLVEHEVTLKFKDPVNRKRLDKIIRVLKKNKMTADDCICLDLAENKRDVGGIRFYCPPLEIDGRFSFLFRIERLVPEIGISQMETRKWYQFKKYPEVSRVLQILVVLSASCLLALNWILHSSVMLLKSTARGGTRPRWSVAE
jgi:hypothetical protein